jgi:hypothetical protein
MGGSNTAGPQIRSYVSSSRDIHMPLVSVNPIEADLKDEA